MTDGTRYGRPHITRRGNALLRAALSDLGERGTLDLGRATARGSRRIWRAGGVLPESTRVGIGYALHASCSLVGDDAPTMHYAYASDRDATRSTMRGRGRVRTRVGERVDVVDPDSGRRILGAIVTGDARATGAWAAVVNADARIERVRHDVRARTLRDAGCGL